MVTLKGFQTFLVKELKELIRDPKIIVGILIAPLVMFPILGLVIGYATQTAQEQAAQATLLVVDNDGGNWSQTFIDFLHLVNVKTIIINNAAPEQVVSQNLMAQNNSTQ